MPTSNLNNKFNAIVKEYFLDLVEEYTNNNDGDTVEQIRERAHSEIAEWVDEEIQEAKNALNKSGSLDDACRLNHDHKTDHKNCVY